ncbi:MAG: nitroreductase family protein [Clostridia bacterium]|nr:nitroreductase family protein [Clostridia bacterium]
MLRDLFYSTRTCRTFDESRIITRDELCDMVDCARLTPSSANIQPLTYRLVYKKDECEKLQPLTKWAGALPELDLPPSRHRPTAFIVICQDTERFGDASKFKVDVGICALAIYMRAAEMGLAGCMIGSFNKESTAEVLSLPENTVPLLIIALGKADEARKIVPLKDGQTKYYRENGVHLVPKRELDDIII